MNCIRKMIKKRSNKVVDYDAKYYTGYRIAMQHSVNETDKAMACIYYLKRAKGEKFINKILYTISNDSMNDNSIFATYIVNYVHIIFNKATTPETKWLAYSCFWNIYRFPRLRQDNLTKFFVKRILNDLPNIEKYNIHKLYCTYFGCLSNISLGEYKKIIYKWLENVDIKHHHSKIHTTIFGLICNISHDDKYKDIVNYKIFEDVLKNIRFDNNSFELTRNTIAMLNNLINTDNGVPHAKNVKTLRYLFIKYRLGDNFYNVLDSIRRENFYNMLNSILEHLGIDSLKVLPIIYAIHYNYKDLVYDWISKEYYNIDDDLLLFAALKYDREKMAKYFILKGANIYKKNRFNLTPYDLYEDKIKEYFDIKLKLDKKYISNIEKGVEKCLQNNKYEVNVCNLINEFVNKEEDIVQISKIINTPLSNKKILKRRKTISREDIRHIMNISGELL